MNEKTWTVVHFIKDDSVEAVPSAWLINDEKCLWPPATWTTEKIINAIKNCIIDTHWQDYDIKTFLNATYRSYETARNKAKKAESDSDLSTTDMENRKRKRKKVIYSSDDDDDQENNNSLSYIRKEPPQYKHPKGKSEKKPSKLFPKDSYKTPRKTTKQKHIFTSQRSETRGETQHEEHSVNKGIDVSEQDAYNGRGVLKGLYNYTLKLFTYFS
ncbi:unnamed protein product [Ceutorhynchus assimilis]|uniref:Uncharacterized protein n=1 Tax=Ceutorhynchus assimilis TaxID=467358 RepID=A0A9N9MI10_9CUCU|nr:unnamed protein product [Ceutorhynchus assimilis]